MGFDVARRIALRQNLSLSKRFLHSYLWSGRGDLVVVLPQTYMNRSGTIVPGLLRTCSATPADLVVVCDNMDLPPGTVRLKRRGVSRAHNGVASIMDALATGEFARLYVGIGRPDEPSRVVEHVLSIPPDGERPSYEAAIDRAAEACAALCDHDIDWVIAMLADRQ